MDNKDFKKEVFNEKKIKNLKSQLEHMFKNRNSRPRAKENIINPNMKGI